MALIECGRGHVYDDEKFPVCPYCMNSRKQRESIYRWQKRGKREDSISQDGW